MAADNPDAMVAIVKGENNARLSVTVTNARDFENRMRNESSTSAPRQNMQQQCCSNGPAFGVQTSSEMHSRSTDDFYCSSYQRAYGKSPVRQHGTRPCHPPTRADGWYPQGRPVHLPPRASWEGLQTSPAQPGALHQKLDVLRSSVFPNRAPGQPQSPHLSSPLPSAPVRDRPQMSSQRIHSCSSTRCNRGSSSLRQWSSHEDKLFRGSLRQYPKVNLQTASTDLIQKLLVYMQNKHSKKASGHRTKRSRSLSRSSHNLLKRMVKKKSSKNIQTYTRSRSASPDQTREMNQGAESGREKAAVKASKSDSDNFRASCSMSPLTSNEGVSYDYDYLKIGSFVPNETDVRYLDQVSRYVRTNMNTLCNKGVCPTILERYNAHRKKYHSEEIDIAALAESTTQICNGKHTDLCIHEKLLARRRFPAYLQRYSILACDILDIVGSHGLVKHQDETCPAGSSKQMVDEICFKIQEIKKSIGSIYCPPSPCHCPGNKPDVLRKIREYYKSEPIIEECDCLQINMHVDEWLKGVPFHAKNSKKTLEIIEYLIKQLKQNIKREIRDPTKWASIIMQCLEVLPMWLPTDPVERNNLRIKLKDDMLERLRNIYQIMKDRTRAPAEACKKIIREWLMKVPFENGSLISRSQLTDELAKIFEQTASVTRRPLLRDTFKDIILRELQQLPVITSNSQKNELAEDLADLIADIYLKREIVKTKGDTFYKIVKLWVSKIPFKEGVQVDLEACSDTLSNALKAAAVSTEEDKSIKDLFTHMILKILKTYPLSDAGVKNKVAMAEELASNLYDLPIGEVKPLETRVYHAIEKWINDFPLKKDESFDVETVIDKLSGDAVGVILHTKPIKIWSRLRDVAQADLYKMPVTISASDKQALSANFANRIVEVMIGETIRKWTDSIPFAPNSDIDKSKFAAGVTKDFLENMQEYSDPTIPKSNLLTLLNELPVACDFSMKNNLVDNLYSDLEKLPMPQKQTDFILDTITHFLDQLHFVGPINKNHVANDICNSVKQVFETYQYPSEIWSNLLDTLSNQINELPLELHDDAKEKTGRKLGNLLIKAKIHETIFKHIIDLPLITKEDRDRLTNLMNTEICLVIETTPSEKTKDAIKNTALKVINKFALACGGDTKRNFAEQLAESLKVLPKFREVDDIYEKVAKWTRNFRLHIEAPRIYNEYVRDVTTDLKEVFSTKNIREVWSGLKAVAEDAVNNLPLPITSEQKKDEADKLVSSFIPYLFDHTILQWSETVPFVQGSVDVETVLKDLSADLEGIMTSVESDFILNSLKEATVKKLNEVPVTCGVAEKEHLANELAKNLCLIPRNVEEDNKIYGLILKWARGLGIPPEKSPIKKLVQDITFEIEEILLKTVPKESWEPMNFVILKKLKQLPVHMTPKQAEMSARDLVNNIVDILLHDAVVNWLKKVPFTHEMCINRDLITSNFVKGLKYTMGSLSPGNLTEEVINHTAVSELNKLPVPCNIAEKQRLAAKLADTISQIPKPKLVIRHAICNWIKYVPFNTSINKVDFVEDLTHKLREKVEINTPEDGWKALITTIEEVLHNAEVDSKNSLLAEKLAHNMIHDMINDAIYSWLHQIPLKSDANKSLILKNMLPEIKELIVTTEPSELKYELCDPKVAVITELPFTCSHHDKKKHLEDLANKLNCVPRDRVEFAYIIEEWIKKIPFKKEPRGGKAKITFSLIKNLRRIAEKTPPNKATEKLRKVVIKIIGHEQLSCSTEEIDILIDTLVGNLVMEMFKRTVRTWVWNMPIKLNTDFNKYEFAITITNKIKEEFKYYTPQEKRDQICELLVEQLEQVPLDCDRDKKKIISKMFAERLVDEIVKYPNLLNQYERYVSKLFNMMPDIKSFDERDVRNGVIELSKVYQELMEKGLSQSDINKEMKNEVAAYIKTKMKAQIPKYALNIGDMLKGVTATITKRDAEKLYNNAIAILKNLVAEGTPEQEQRTVIQENILKQLEEIFEDRGEKVDPRAKERLAYKFTNQIFSSVEQEMNKSNEKSTDDVNKKENESNRMETLISDWFKGIRELNVKKPADKRALERISKNMANKLTSIQNSKASEKSIHDKMVNVVKDGLESAMKIKNRALDVRKAVNHVNELISQILNKDTDKIQNEGSDISIFIMENQRERSGLDRTKSDKKLSFVEIKKPSDTANMDKTHKIEESKTLFHAQTTSQHILNTMKDCPRYEFDTSEENVLVSHKMFKVDSKIKESLTNDIFKTAMESDNVTTPAALIKRKIIESPEALKKVVTNWVNELSNHSNPFIYLESNQIVKTLTKRLSRVDPSFLEDKYTRQKLQLEIKDKIRVALQNQYKKINSKTQFKLAGELLDKLSRPIEYLSLETELQEPTIWRCLKTWINDIPQLQPRSYIDLKNNEKFVRELAEKFLYLSSQEFDIKQIQKIIAFDIKLKLDFVLEDRQQFMSSKNKKRLVNHLSYKLLNFYNYSNHIHNSNQNSSTILASDACQESECKDIQLQENDKIKNKDGELKVEPAHESGEEQMLTSKTSLLNTIHPNVNYLENKIANILNTVAKNRGTLLDENTMKSIAGNIVYKLRSNMFCIDESKLSLECTQENYNNKVDMDRFSKKFIHFLSKELKLNSNIQTPVCEYVALENNETVCKYPKNSYQEHIATNNLEESAKCINANKVYNKCNECCKRNLEITITKWIDTVPEFESFVSSNKKENEKLNRKLLKVLTDMNHSIHFDINDTEVLAQIREIVKTSLKIRGKYLDPHKINDYSIKLLIALNDNNKKLQNIENMISTHVSNWVKGISDLFSAFPDQKQQMIKSFDLLSHNISTIMVREEQDYEVRKEITNIISLALEKAFTMIGEPLDSNTKKKIEDQLLSKIIKQKEFETDNSYQMWNRLISKWIETVTLLSTLTKPQITLFNHILAKNVACMNISKSSKNRPKQLQSIKGYLDIAFENIREHVNSRTKMRLAEKLLNFLIEEIEMADVNLLYHPSNNIQLKKNFNKHTEPIQTYSNLLLNISTKHQDIEMPKTLIKIITNWIEDIPQLTCINKQQNKHNLEVINVLGRILMQFDEKYIQNNRKNMIDIIRNKLTSVLKREDQQLSYNLINDVTCCIFHKLEMYSKYLSRLEEAIIDTITKYFENESERQMGGSGMFEGYRITNFTKTLARKFKFFNIHDLKNNTIKHKLLFDTHNQIKNILITDTTKLTSKALDNITEIIFKKIEETIAHFERFEMLSEFLFKDVMVSFDNVSDASGSYSFSKKRDDIHCKRLYQVKANIVTKLNNEIHSNMFNDSIKKNYNRNTILQLADMLLNNIYETINQFILLDEKTWQQCTHMVKIWLNSIKATVFSNVSTSVVTRMTECIISDLKRLKKNSNIESNSDYYANIKPVFYKYVGYLEKYNRKIDSMLKDNLAHKITEQIIKADKQYKKTTNEMECTLEKAIVDWYSIVCQTFVKTNTHKKDIVVCSKKLSNNIKEILSIEHNKEEIRKKIKLVVVEQLLSKLIKDSEVSGHAIENNGERKIIDKVTHIQSDEPPVAPLATDQYNIVTTVFQWIQELIEVSVLNKTALYKLVVDLVNIFDKLEPKDFETKLSRDIALEKIENKVKLTYERNGYFLPIKANQMLSENLVYRVAFKLRDYENKMRLPKVFQREVAQWLANIPGITDTSERTQWENEKMSQDLGQKLIDTYFIEPRDKYRRQEMFVIIREYLDNALEKRNCKMPYRERNQLADRLVRQIFSLTNKLPEIKEIATKNETEIIWEWFQKIPSIRSCSIENKLKLLDDLKLKLQNVVEQSLENSMKTIEIKKIVYEWLVQHDTIITTKQRQELATLLSLSINNKLECDNCKRESLSNIQSSHTVANILTVKPNPKKPNAEGVTKQMLFAFNPQRRLVNQKVFHVGSLDSTASFSEISKEIPQNVEEEIYEIIANNIEDLKHSNLEPVSREIIEVLKEGANFSSAEARKLAHLIVQQAHAQAIQAIAEEKDLFKFIKDELSADLVDFGIDPKQNVDLVEYLQDLIGKQLLQGPIDDSQRESIIKQIMEKSGLSYEDAADLLDRMTGRTNQMNSSVPISNTVKRIRSGSGRRSTLSLGEQTDFEQKAKRTIKEFMYDRLENPTEEKIAEIDKLVNNAIADLLDIIGSPIKNDEEKRDSMVQVLAKYLELAQLDTNEPIDALAEELMAQLDFLPRSSLSQYNKQRKSNANDLQRDSLFNEAFETELSEWVKRQGFPLVVSGDEADDLIKDFTARLNSLRNDPNAEKVIRDEIKTLLRGLYGDLDADELKQLEDDLFSDLIKKKLMKKTDDTRRRSSRFSDSKRKSEGGLTKKVDLFTPGKDVKKVIDEWVDGLPIDKITAEQKKRIDRAKKELNDRINLIRTQLDPSSPEYEQAVKEEAKKIMREYLTDPYKKSDERYLEEKAKELFRSIVSIPIETSDRLLESVKLFRSPLDKLYDYIEEWCRNLPTPDNLKDAIMLKQNLASKLINKIGELNMNPDIFNDELLYLDILQDEVDQLILEIPLNPELEKYVPAMKKDFISKIMEIRKYILDEVAGKAYKLQLRDTVHNTLPLPLNLSPEEQASFELIKDKVADAFINMNYSIEGPASKCKHKRKISEEIDKFCDDLLHHYPCVPLDTDQLKTDLYNALLRVPVPRDDSMKSEIEQVRIRDIINSWMKEIPLRQETTPEKLHRYKLAAILGKRLHDIEIEKEYNPYWNADPKIGEEITKFLKKISIRADSTDKIPHVVLLLINKLKDSAKIRKFISIQRSVSVETQVDICTKYPCTLNKSERSHLMQINDRVNKRCSKQISVCPAANVSCQTEDIACAPSPCKSKDAGNMICNFPNSFRIPTPKTSYSRSIQCGVPSSCPTKSNCPPKFQSEKYGSNPSSYPANDTCSMTRRRPNTHSEPNHFETSNSQKTTSALSSPNPIFTSTPLNEPRNEHISPKILIKEFIWDTPFPNDTGYEPQYSDKGEQAAPPSFSSDPSRTRYPSYRPSEQMKPTTRYGECPEHSRRSSVYTRYYVNESREPPCNFTCNENKFDADTTTDEEWSIPGPSCSFRPRFQYKNPKKSSHPVRRPDNRQSTPEHLNSTQNDEYFRHPQGYNTSYPIVEERYLCKCKERLVLKNDKGKRNCRNCGGSCPNPRYFNYKF